MLRWYNTVFGHDDVPANLVECVLVHTDQPVAEANGPFRKVPFILIFDEPVTS